MNGITTVPLRMIVDSSFTGCIPGFGQNPLYLGKAPSPARSTFTFEFCTKNWSRKSLFGKVSLRVVMHPLVPLDYDKSKYIPMFLNFPFLLF